MDNEMIERVGVAIAKAGKELSFTYGVFDYSGYGKEVKPHVVRDFTNKTNQNIGEFDTSEEAQDFYVKVCRNYVAKAAVLAMREPTENLIKFHTKGNNLFDRGDLFDWNCNCYYCGGHKFAVQSYIDAIIGDK